MKNHTGGKHLEKRATYLSKEIIYEGYYLQDYLKSSSGLNKQEMMDVFRLLEIQGALRPSF